MFKTTGRYRNPVFLTFRSDESTARKATNQYVSMEIILFLTFLSFKMSKKKNTKILIGLCHVQRCAIYFTNNLKYCVHRTKEILFNSDTFQQNMFQKCVLCNFTVLSIHSKRTEICIISQL